MGLSMIASKDKEHSMNYYGNLTKFDTLRIENRYTGYIYLLDSEGLIRWRSHGEATSESLEFLFNAKKTLL